MERILGRGAAEAAELEPVETIAREAGTSAIDLGAVAGRGDGGAGKRERRRSWWGVLLGALGVLVTGLVLFFATAGFWADWLWYGSLGFRSVLLTRVLAWAALFAGGGIVAGLFFGLNARFALRELLRTPVVMRGRQFALPAGPLNGALLAGSLLVGALFGLVAASQRQLVLAFLHRSDFGIVEPVYNKDASFYVFTLPLLTAARSWLFGLLTLTLLAAGALAILRLGKGERGRGLALPRDARGQLSLLGMLLLALISFNYWLANYELLFSDRGVARGAGRTDLFAQRPANWVLLAISLLAAAFLAWNAFARRLRALIVTLGAWVIAAILIGLVFPAAYQNFFVRPNEFGQERDYIANNIALTRQAYNLDSIATGRLAGDAAIGQTDIAANAEAIDNIRIWDYRPLLTTYQQIQRFRQYYEFDDIDIDRYQLPESTVASQTMLAARELDTDLLDTQAQTWQNRHLIYTHGYGVVVSPVNLVNAQGQPEFYVRDIPPSGIHSLRIDRPQIYFGELTGDYAIVNTREREFDRPATATGNGSEEYTRYSGTVGVPVGSFPTRLLYAAALGDINILLSGSLTGDSRILYHRAITDRVHRVAPFLTLDHDPYLVILDGKLLWIQDAYTTTDRFPYSTPASDLGPNGDFNYIRNSVKVTVDAYTGEMRFYAMDERDALLRTYRSIYPDLFTPLSAAPAGLTDHFRYPEDLFNAQADLYRRYHMTDPQTFYSQEDLWNVARETYAEKVQRMQAYYVTMRLPGEDREEFALILPFTPAGPGRNNMVSWMAARSDGASYGELRAYSFPQGSNILGPQQVEARINQDPEISAQLTLLNQIGSTVIRGNLLIFPMGDALLYVQPLYLQATINPLPELQRVIVTSSNPDQGVVMSDRLDTALAALAEGRHGVILGGAATPGTGTPSPGATDDLAAQALDHFTKARVAAERGDWATYGRELEELERVLKLLNER